MDSSKDSVVNRETAEQEFARFVSAMDIDVDESKMSDEDKASLASVRETFVSAVERGQLIIDEEGQPVLTLSTGKTVTFHEPTGATYMAIRKARANTEQDADQVAFTTLTRSQQGTYAQIKRRDLVVCNAILALFLG